MSALVKVRLTALPRKISDGQNRIRTRISKNVTLFFDLEIITDFQLPASYDHDTYTYRKSRSTVDQLVKRGNKRTE